MNNNHDRNTIIVIIVLVLFAAIGIISSYRIFTDPNRNNVQMEIPTVSSTLQSRDGETHQVNINFVVSVDKKLEGKINDTQLHTALTNAMNSMEYDLLQEADNVEYIKQLAWQSIEQDFPTEYFQGIYIQGIRIDAPIESPSGTGSGGGDSVLKGLFQNVK